MSSLDSSAVIVSFDWQESRSDDSVPYPVSYSKFTLLAITFVEATFLDYERMWPWGCKIVSFGLAVSFKRCVITNPI